MYKIPPGAENLIGTEVLIRLGKGITSTVVSNKVIPKTVFYENVVDAGFLIKRFDIVSNKTAQFEPSRKRTSKLKKETVLLVAEKINEPKVSRPI